MKDFSIDLIWAKVQIEITALGGWLGYFLGGMDGLMIALIVLMTLDYVSGVMWPPMHECRPGRTRCCILLPPR